MNYAASKQMPQYQCHKKVWALKISGVGPEQLDGSSPLFTEDGFAPIAVTREWRQKNKPEIGGYYVVYADGYTSYSPQQAFEEGYSLLSK